MAEALAHPLTAVRDMLVDVPHPQGGALRLVGNPMKTGGPRTFTAPPPLGHHDAEIRARLRAEIRDGQR